MNRVRNNVKRGLIATVGIAASLTACVLTAAPAQALYGQKDAVQGDFPYWADLPGVCGGAAIDPEWVLTAAHCVGPNTVGNEVRIGWTSDGAGTPIISTVLEVHATQPGTDVALLRIAPRPNVPTIQLSDQDVPIGGTYVSVAAGAGSNGHLGSAEFRVTGKGSNNQSAVGVTGAEANCFGDSGSPAIVRTAQGDRLIAVNYAILGCEPGNQTYSMRMSDPDIWNWIHALIPARSDFASSHPGTYQLKNVKSGQLLDVNGGSTQPGAELIQYPTVGSTNQQWTFDTHDGHTRIVSKRSSQVVAVSGGLIDAGMGIIQWPATGGTEQDWDFVPTAGGHYNIVNAKSGHLLVVSGGTTNVGERTIQWPSNGAADQEWDLVKVG